MLTLLVPEMVSVSPATVSASPAGLAWTAVRQLVSRRVFQPAPSMDHSVLRLRAVCVTLAGQELPVTYESAT